jgi:IS5 family transposase
LQSAIRKVSPEALESIHKLLCTQWYEQGQIDDTRVRINSTVVEADIAPPSDSQLLNDCIRVLSRQLATCHRHTGLKVRFTDQKDKAKRLRLYFLRFINQPIIGPTEFSSYNLLLCGLRLLLL